MKVVIYNESCVQAGQCGDLLYRNECQRCKEKHLNAVTGPIASLVFGAKK
jgi:hypothetical protein